MKKEYTKPNMTIVSFRSENIASVSSGGIQAQSAFGTLNIGEGKVDY